MNKLLIRALVTMNVLIIVAAGFMMPLWSDFVTKIGGNLTTAGNAIFIFSIVIGFIGVFAGKLEATLQRDEVFVFLAQIIMAIGFAGYFFVSSPVELYLVQLILGVGGAFQAPALFSLYHKVIDTDNSPFYWGVWTGSYNVSIGVGALISAYITHHFGYIAVFAVLFLIALIGVGLSYVIMLHLKKKGIEKSSPGAIQL